MDVKLKIVNREELKTGDIVYIEWSTQVGGSRSYYTINNFNGMCLVNLDGTGCSFNSKTIEELLASIKQCKQSASIIEYRIFPKEDYEINIVRKERN